MSTKIEWTRGDDGRPGEVWNPTVGCSRVSPGCANCYAIRVAHRAMQPAHVGLTVLPDGGGAPDWTGEVRTLPDRLDVPRRWRRPRFVFVDSMSDLFEASVPEGFIRDVFATMADTPQHTYQVLTKRPQRMEAVLWSPSFWFDLWGDRPGPIPTHLPNVWLGTSIESDRYAWRADYLRRVPAAVRFVSAEPLLGPLPSLDLDGIGWVIVGGESGPRSRPMHPDWARDLRDRCAAAGVPFFFKQWGEWLPVSQAPSFGVDAGYAPAPGEWDRAPSCGIARRVGKVRAGRTLDGVTHDGRPPVSRGTTGAPS